ncbi:MAG TPA: GHMP kinase, partial [Anaerolineae bacterium]
MEVRVEASARLHLGLLDLNGELGRLYGSLGVAIDRPRLVLNARLLTAGAAGAPLVVEGCEAERVADYARRFLACYSLPGPLHLRLEE